ncbi:hypothetical protein DL96DRAFT_1560829 [Flagelloscypha sp. PMI_526]|nr:hypothetical protein DL96DRAFT_1560829 [Flagelloscypha sp. PMI_526]
MFGKLRLCTTTSGEHWVNRAEHTKTIEVALIAIQGGVRHVLDLAGPLIVNREKAANMPFEGKNYTRNELYPSPIGDVGKESTHSLEQALAGSSFKKAATVPTEY